MPKPDVALLATMLREEGVPFIRNIVDGLNSNRAIRSAKNARNHLVDLTFRFRGRSQADRILERIRPDAGNVCFTIAFNVPWTVELLAASWARYCKGTELIVANNSSDPARRREINSLCQNQGVLHFDLPFNPEWNPCRSHGIAMNWVYYNVVRHLQPEIFGFLDHDCFPIKELSLASRMSGVDVYGLRRLSTKLPGLWNMWAGFCFFRFRSISNCAVDFKHQVELGLDTGGGNWPGVYRSIHASKVLAAEYRFVDQGVDAYREQHTMIDETFLHIGGASFRPVVQGQAATRFWTAYLERGGW